MTPLFEKLLNSVEDLKNMIPTATAEGTEINVTDGANARVKSVELYGDITQSETPTIEEPVDVETVGSNIKVTISDDSENSKNYALDLGNLELVGDDEIGRDYIFRKNGKWYKHSFWSKQIFNGEEIFSSYNDSDSAKTFLFCEASATSKDYSKMFSNYFTYASSYNGTNGLIVGNKIAIRAEGINIYFCVDTTTLELFKSWLQECYDNGNPVIAYYQLATAIDEEITDTNLLSQLESLLNMKTYKNTTNISVTSDNLQPTLKIEYYQDLESLINKINNSEEES